MKTIAKAILGGAIGVVAVLVAIHVYNDHSDFHKIRESIVKAALAKQALPMPEAPK